MPKDIDLTDIYARLTAHEFLLEVFTANITADWPDGNVAEFWKNMTKRSPYLSKGPVDVEVLEEHKDQYWAIIENFSRKSMKRREEVIQGRESLR